MSRSITEPLWQQLSADLTREMSAWRLLHPTASLRQSQTELDARLSRLRLGLLEDLIHTSQKAVWPLTPASPPLCPDCQHPLDDRGAKTRTLQTHGGHKLTLRRNYAVCPASGAGLFPPR